MSVRTKGLRCQPLCPIHYEVMTASSDGQEAIQSGITTAPEGQHYSCAVLACRMNYSPELGYFALEKNDDHWEGAKGSRSSSFRIRRWPIQAVCGDRDKFLMYLESLDANGDVENFRCPHED